MTAANDHRPDPHKRQAHSDEAREGTAPDANGSDNTNHRRPDWLADDSADPLTDERALAFTDLIAGELDAQTADALRAEIDGDEALQREFDALHEAWRLFDALPPIEPSKSLEQAVLHSVRDLARTPEAPAATGASTSTALADAPTPVHLRPVPEESAMTRPSRGSSASIWAAGLQFAGTLAAAAALLLVVGLMFRTPEPPPHFAANPTAAHHPVAMEPAADAIAENNRAQAQVRPDDPTTTGGGDVPSVAGMQDPNAGPRNANGNANGGAGNANGQAVNRTARVIDADVSEPKNPFGEMISAPLTPDEINPVGRVRYRGMDGWQDLSPNDAISHLNCEIAVEPGKVARFEMGGSTLNINGGFNGAIVALVPDPTAGTDASGNPRGVMVEMTTPAQVYLEIGDDSETGITVRTPDMVAAVRDARAEFAYGSNGVTNLAVASGRVEIAGFDRLGAVAQALVGEGEVATISLLGKPDVRKNLNTNWVGQWAKTAAAKIDPRVEKPLSGETLTISAEQRGAVGSLVANDPDYQNVPFVIDSHAVNVEIVDQIAVTTVEEVFHNTTDRTLEGIFYFPLPAGASISQFSMWVTQPDGSTREVQGEWKDRKEARRIYDEYKYQRRDPALLEWVEGNQFKMSIFPIFADEKKKIKITYTQLLEPQNNVVRFVYPLVSEKLRGNPVRHMSVRATVSTGTDVATIGCISHLTSDIATADRQVVWSGGFQADNYVPGRDFIIEYKIADSADAFYSRAMRMGDMQGHVAGFFTPSFAAESTEREAGRVIFMVDTSGSMNSEMYVMQLALLEQLLAKLTPDDMVNVVTYDYSAALLLEEFVPATEAQRKAIVAALADRLRYGATNLRNAFREAWKHLKRREANTIVLLGDGIATQGEVRSAVLAREIAEMPVGSTEKNLRDANVRVRIFPVAIGNTYDRAMIETLATQFQGRVVRATREMAPETVASEFASALTTPALTDLKVEIDGAVVTDVYPAQFPAILPGQQISFVARYAASGQTTVRITGRVGDETQSWEFPMELPETGTAGPIARFWAARAIDGKQALLDAGIGVEDELIADIVEYSKSYRVSSRHTSLLVLENDDEFKRWNTARIADAVERLKVSGAEEPALVIENFSGNIRIQPEGSTEWISLGDYLRQTDGNTRISLRAKIAADFDASATLRIGAAGGERFVIREKSTISGMDLPGASGLWQEWQQTQTTENNGANGSANGEENAPAAGNQGADNSGSEAVSEAFRARTEKLVDDMKRLHEEFLLNERTRIAKLLAEDLPAAKEALARFETRVGEFLTTEAQKQALAEHVKKFRELLESDEDPLVTWEIMKQLTRGGMDAVEGKLAADKSKAEADGMMFRDSAAPARRARGGANMDAEESLDEAAEELRTLQRRLGDSAPGGIDGGAAEPSPNNGPAGSESGPTFGDGDATTEDPGQVENELSNDGNDGNAAPATGSAAAAGGRHNNRAEDARPQTATPPAAPRPAPPTEDMQRDDADEAAQSQQWGQRNRHEELGGGSGGGHGSSENALPMQPGEPREGELDDAIDREQEALERLRQGFTRNRDETDTDRAERQGLNSQSAPESNARSNPVAPENAPADQQNQSANEGNTNGSRPSSDIPAEDPGTDPSSSTDGNKPAGDASMATFEGRVISAQSEWLRLMADPNIRQNVRDWLQRQLEREIGEIDARRVLQGNLVFEPRAFIPMSRLIDGYTERVVAQFKAHRGPVVADVQFAPEGAKLLGQMQAARLASIRDQQDAAARFHQSDNGITAFVLDCSFTMREALTDAQRDALTIADENVRAQIRTKFDLARYELINALGALADGERFALVLVAREVQYLKRNLRLATYSAENDFADGVLHADARQMARISRMLRGLVADDVANLGGALDALHSTALFDATAPSLGRVVYLITDGWASWSPDSTGYLATTGLGNGASLENFRAEPLTRAFIDAQEKLPITIHAVAVGNHDAQPLATIAEITGGKFIDTTAGNTAAQKTMADETPMKRAERLIAELKHTPRNAAGWLALLNWAMSDVVAGSDKALEEVPLFAWLAWAEVHPSNHIIYEELGEWLDSKGRHADALRAFSNIVETGYASPETHRYLGNFYRSKSMWEAARDEYRIARNQAWHIAIVYFNEANVEAHLGNYDAARELLANIAEHNDWPARYRNIKERAARELLVLYQQLQKQEMARAAAAKTPEEKAQAEAQAKKWADAIESDIANSPYDKAGLREFVNADLIVILDWDTDGTDVDLWLLRNGNEGDKCFYSEPKQSWGAHLHEDQTEGFGPEFITLPSAAAGEYTVKIHYYSNANNQIRSYCHVKVIANVGTAAEQVYEHHVKLTESGQAVTIRTVKLGGE